MDLKIRIFHKFVKFLLDFVLYVSVNEMFILINVCECTSMLATYARYHLAAQSYRETGQRKTMILGVLATMFEFQSWE
jgi:hypothetical protein